VPKAHLQIEATSSAPDTFDRAKATLMEVFVFVPSFVYRQDGHELSCLFIRVQEIAQAQKV
jgi:hypothetical protein